MPVKKSEVIIVPSLNMEEIRVAIVGLTGLYVHRMSSKEKLANLIGGSKKTQSEKTSSVRHNPREEFLDCMYVDQDWNAHSHIKFPAIAFKAAMGTAALVTPGMKKTDVSRMVFIPDEWVPIYGNPTMRMTVMRLPTMGNPPDTRTRPFFPVWATELTLQFVRPLLTKKSILTLLNNAGIVAGVGDSRQEKGKGNSGAFQVAPSIPKELKDAAAQWKAIQNPVPYDKESAELLERADERIAELSV